MEREKYIGSISITDIVGADEIGVSVSMTIECATCQETTGLMAGLTDDRRHMIIGCMKCRQVVTVIDCGDQYTDAVCHICNNGTPHHH